MNLDKSLEEIISERKQKKPGTSGARGPRKPRITSRPRRQPFRKTYNRSYNQPRIGRRGQLDSRRPRRDVSAVQCWR